MKTGMKSGIYIKHTSYRPLLFPTEWLRALELCSGVVQDRKEKARIRAFFFQRSMMSFFSRSFALFCFVPASAATRKKRGRPPLLYCTVLARCFCLYFTLCTSMWIPPGYRKIYHRRLFIGAVVHEELQ